jgi:hypothetical protein
VAVPLSSIVSWDAVFNSQALSERIAEKLDDGRGPDEIRGAYAGDFRFDSGRLTPQFFVRADNDDGEQAILLADTAVEEGLTLFEENRRARVDYVLAAFQDQMDEADAQAQDARADFNRFLVENNAYSLPGRLAEQTQLVSDLRLQAQLAGVVGADSTAVNESPLLTEARSELDRLLALEPEYGRLELEVTLAKSAVTRLQAEADALEVAGAGYSTALLVVEESLTEAEGRVSDAEAAMAEFNAANNVESLPSAIGNQQTIVNELLLIEVSASGALSAAGALALAEATLLELQVAQPEYERLANNLTDTETLVVIRENQESVIAQISPIEDQIEVVTSASLVSGLWWTIIRYTVAVTLAIFLALTAVYLIALFERTPPTVQDLEREFGKPVIARIPRASEEGGGR